MTADVIIQDWLKDTQQALIDNYDKLGLRASGKWADSLEPYQTPKGASYEVGMLGMDYTRYLENGRGKNQDQSPEGLKAWVGWAGSTFLKDWADDKGIIINTFAVAWKIAREGWKVPNKHNAGGLVTDVVNDGRIDDLNKKIALHTIGELRSDIIKGLNNGSNGN